MIVRVADIRVCTVTYIVWGDGCVAGTDRSPEPPSSVQDKEPEKCPGGPKGESLGRSGRGASIVAAPDRCPQQSDGDLPCAQREHGPVPRGRLYAAEHLPGRICVR